MSKETHIQNLERAQAETLLHASEVQHAPYRQKFHLSAPQGWLNDPNGLIYFRGRYHFFYQYNPFGTFWDEMYWGHAVSDDMIHFTHLPPALAPSEWYDHHPKGGVFSGSAIVRDNRLYLIYTGTYNRGNGFEQAQCLAVSDDGVHFEKYVGNPIIKTPTDVNQERFRDPKVWMHKGRYYLVLGTQKGSYGQARLYRSDDLYHWEPMGVLYESRGDLGFAWECPDVFELNGKTVLCISPMGCGDRKSLWMVGTLDYETGKFQQETMGENDWGFDFYAPQTLQAGDGRRISVGWANNWDWMPWFKDWGPTWRHGYCGAFAIPREVRLTAGNRLAFLPIREIERIRGNVYTLDCMIVSGEKNPLPTTGGPLFDLVLSIDCETTSADDLEFSLREIGERRVILTVDLQKCELRLDRSAADGWSRGIARAPFFPKGKKSLSLRVLSDTSSVEVFFDNGECCVSANVYDASDNMTNSLTVRGEVACLRNVCLYHLIP